MTQPPSLETMKQLIASTLPDLKVTVIERVPQGVSTYVYRLSCGDTRYYLRVLPEEEASFAPEARVLELLHERGIGVPQVVYFSHREPSLGRSVLLTTEIPGRALAEVGVGEHTAAVLFEAGRMLAIINTLPVEGFGWVAHNQERVTTLQAEHATFRAFILDNFDEHLRALEASVLTPQEVARLRSLLHRYDAWLDPGPAVLAHGDFDVTPIFQNGRRCSGIIDFGEIRGAHQWYDLGHFHYHDCETLPAPLLPSLLDGYRSITPLPDDAQHRVAFAAVLIGQRALARLLQKHGAATRFARSVAAGSAALKRDIATLSV